MLKSFIQKLKGISNQNLLLLLVTIVLLQPILDLDYLLYGFLDQFGIPLPSTIVYFIFYPLIIMLVYFLKEQNKLKVFLFVLLYGLFVLTYFIFHHLYVQGNFEQLYLTNRYAYSMLTELQYVLTLIIPIGLIYAFFKAELNQSLINKIAIITSILIAHPIFISNLLVFSPSTYYDGPTKANFISWFFDGYQFYHPKSLTSQFFFSEGNTTGIILFAIYPILIRQVFVQGKWAKWIALLVFVQGWAMYILATRVATYGVVLMLGVVLAIYLFLVLIKKEQWQPIPFSLILSMILVFYFSLPFTPAIKNLAIDNRNDQAVKDDEYLRLQWKDTVNNTDLIPGTAQFNYYYQHIFEEYNFLLTIPDIYWEWYYPYKIDPKFYIDLIFEYDFSQRTSGRQFQQIFFEYKWKNLSNDQKMLGFGYSRFMNGSVLLEQDFIMQKYTMGYIGSILLTSPWILVSLYIVGQSIRKIKHIFNFDYIMVVLAFFSILGGAYLSGHILDQFFSSTFLAILAGFVIHQINHIENSK